MSILDRYIARQFLFNVAALLLLLFSFVVLVDVSLNIDRFLRLAGESPGNPEGLRRFLVAVFLIADLWWPRLLQLFNYVNGLVLVGAMGFTFTQLVRHRELVAALAGGVSLYRLARPVLIVAALMLGVQALNQELVIPRIAPLLARGNNDAGRRDLSAFPVPLTPDSSGRVLYAKNFDPSTGTLTNLYALERSREGVAMRKIVADSAVWSGASWRLTNGYARPAGVASRSEADPRIARAEPIATLSTNIDPTTLLANRYRSFAQSLSWSQIGTVLGTPGLSVQVREQMQRIGWGRVSTMVTIILGLLICMPFFLVREPANMAVQSLKCAPLAIVALLGGVLGSAIPIQGDVLPPSIAVFLPVLVLLPLAIAMVTSVKT